MSSSDIPTKMRALRLVKYNTNYKLENDVPVPEPGIGEVLVRVHASGFCHTDYQVYQGVYSTKLPMSPSHEPAGMIAALGPRVPSEWQVGQRVGVINFRSPCGDCNGCRWQKQKSAASRLDARYCDNKTMSGITVDGGFAEYMVTEVACLVHLPDRLPFEQAAPLMCAGATVWNAIRGANLNDGDSIAIIGIGGLGVLGIQFAKALGYRTVAIDNRDIGLQLAAKATLKPDLIVSYNDPDATAKIAEFSGGVGLKAVVVCTDNVSASNWSITLLQPHGTCVVLGLPDNGYLFDSFALVFREIVVKGSLHAPPDAVEEMMEVVEKHNIMSHLTTVHLDDAEMLPERVAAHDFQGRLVVLID
ncbi:hypothetical protein ETB97_012723 [Aspergillus alliaceus]|uniref:Enoyl reductase (ER) domain-containing protein n=1 Tax=Petromyces alliaceus TaxID=209559 RepID=A0A8H6A6T9_PETAA|nr:hypothetical protein ETB97_012723 [Aspergillus burnettii]